jgi:hypothetical protein
MNTTITTLRRSVTALATVAMLAGLSLAGTANAGKSFAKFDANDQLVRPTGYREWIYIGAPLTPNELNNGKAAFPEFHNVYIDPVSWEHWKQHGEFREGTIIVKELVSVGGKTSSSGNGYFMGEYIGLEAVVKDSSRFPAADKHWGFFRFTTEDHSKLLRASTVLKSESCAACHTANAKQDAIFTQHYPVLRAAKGRGEQGVGGK